jgi:hypothetical protein
MITGERKITITTYACDLCGATEEVAPGNRGVAMVRLVMVDLDPDVTGTSDSLQHGQIDVCRKCQGSGRAKGVSFSELREAFARTGEGGV